MCPFLEAPEGISREALKLLDNAFFDTWQALQTGSGVVTAPKVPQHKPDRTCDQKLSVARLPDRSVPQRAYAPESGRPRALATQPATG